MWFPSPTSIFTLSHSHTHIFGHLTNPEHCQLGAPGLPCDSAFWIHPLRGTLAPPVVHVVHNPTAAWEWLLIFQLPSRGSESTLLLRLAIVNENART